MNNKNLWIFPIVCVVCCATFLSALNQESPQKPKPVATNADSFIRMDLLRKEKNPMPPPKRNVFTIKSASVFEDLSPEEIKEKIETAMSTPDSPSEGEEQTLPLNLRYLGYVLSGRKTVGLIVFGGEALAVVEGDVITEGYTVGRVSFDEIEVLGPDQEPLTFSLEGEFP